MKSALADSTPINWLFATDGRMFWICLEIFGPGYPVSKIYGYGDMIPEASAGDAYATVLVGDTVANDDNGPKIYMLRDAYINSIYSAPRAYGGAGACVRGAILASTGYYSWPTFPNPITGGFAFAPMEYRDTGGDAFVRAVVPGLRVGLAFGVESVTPPRSLLSASGRDYAVSLSSGSMYNTTGMVAYAFDVKGPWR